MKNLKRYDSVACPTISDSSKEWIANEFGDAKDFNDLLSQMNYFVCHNFVYDKIVQYLMGHNDAKTTLDIYTDVHEDFVKQTMSRFAGQIYLG